MLIKTNSKMNRRRVLRGILNGAAVSLSLPFLELFLNESGTAMAATGQPLPERFGTWFWGLGIDPGIFIPKTFGANYDIPEQLKPLADLKQHINIFSNFDIATDGKPNICHYTGWVAARTGVVPPGRGDVLELNANAIHCKSSARLSDCAQGLQTEHRPMTPIDTTGLQRLCRDRAEECRTLAQRPELPARSKIMLEHLADGWDGVEQSLKESDQVAAAALPNIATLSSRE